MAAKKGFFKPKNYTKYKGDPTKIIYRSSWEKLFMGYLDDNPNVVEWSSEEFFIPYKNPVDGKVRRYFPDFYVKKKNKQGGIDVLIIEIKPHHQTQQPLKESKISRAYVNKVKTYAINESKWKAARAFCDDRKWKFQILTENELGL